jgi:hypothetical protein
MGTSGLLVKKTRSRTFSNDRASAKSCRMIRMLFSSSHSSSASITTTYVWLPRNFDNGPMISCCHWSRRERLAISLSFIIASLINRLIVGIVLAIWIAMLVTNLPACPISPPPRAKKKLAPRQPCSKHRRATVRAIVDFPVPAKPFSQKILHLSCPSAHSNMSRRRSTRVFGRQVGSCCFAKELNGASTA